jgi:hypothetical protein
LGSSAGQYKSACDYDCASAFSGARPFRSSTAHIQSWERTLDPSKREVLGRLSELGGQLIEGLVLWQVQRKATGADAWEAIQRAMIFADTEVGQARKAAGRQAEEPAHPSEQHEPLCIRDLHDIFPEEQDNLRILYAMSRLKSPRRHRATRIRPRQGQEGHAQEASSDLGVWRFILGLLLPLAGIDAKLAQDGHAQVLESQQGQSLGRHDLMEACRKRVQKESSELECMTNRARVVALEYKTNASREFLRGVELIDYLCR